MGISMLGVIAASILGGLGVDGGKGGDYIDAFAKEVR